MVTIKSFTSLEQSKKLAEILPLESADMYWWSTSLKYYIEAMDDGDFNEEEGHIRAWSIAALLNIIEQAALFKTPQGWVCKTYIGQKVIDLNNYYDEALDACYEMILKLHELNLL